MIDPALSGFVGDGSPLETPLAQLRAASDRTGLEMAGDAPIGMTEQDHALPVDGSVIRARVFRAVDAPARGAPAVVYFHGGGWATGSVDGFAAIARNLARSMRGVAVAIDYRLAPEHAFPGPVQDCMAGTRWAFSQSEALGIDPRRIHLAGDSAGAHLALSVAFALRDERNAEPQARAAVPNPAGIAAFYPCLDPGCDTPSWDELGRGHFLTHERMRWYWRALLGEKRLARPDAQATPWLADDLSGLPPTWIATAEHDPLRDEGEAFAHDLREAGVEVAQQRCPGMLHGFLRWRSLVPQAADDAVRNACDWLLKPR